MIAYLIMSCFILSTYKIIMKKSEYLIDHEDLIILLQVF